MPDRLSEQRAIAHILGTLDDKIELNRRMNETLEAIARALFKSWFVDFDPVRAKAEGRDPGLPPHLADLFPDSFEDSELGEIPAGWRGRRSSEKLDCTRTGTPSRMIPSSWAGDIRLVDSERRPSFGRRATEYSRGAGIASSAASATSRTTAIC